MNKVLFSISVLLLLFSCKTKQAFTQTSNNKNVINQLLNQWHRDVAEFNFESYFNKMTDNAVFIGTDASEVWSKREFQDFSKPYFEKKQTWDFKPIERNIYTEKNGKTAWFDELLDTWMGICRGSGVVVYENDSWKLQHYVLSVAVPNDNMKEVVAIKKEKDSLFLQSKK